MFKFVMAAAATLALVGSAQAFTVTTSPYDAATPTGQQVVVNFDGGFNVGNLGVTESDTGNVVLYTGSHPGVAAAPAGDVTQYEGIGTGGSAIFDFSGYNSSHKVTEVSVYWGSADSYNTLSVLNKSLAPIFTLTGASLPQDNGDWYAPGSNVLVNISGIDPKTFGGLEFSSSGVAFEFDNIAASTLRKSGGGSSGGSGGVPEPATWAVMLAGFAMVGAAARRRRTVATA